MRSQAEPGNEKKIKPQRHQDTKDYESSFQGGLLGQWYFRIETQALAGPDEGGHIEMSTMDRTAK